MSTSPGTKEPFSASSACSRSTCHFHMRFREAGNQKAGANSSTACPLQALKRLENWLTKMHSRQTK